MSITRVKITLITYLWPVSLLPPTLRPVSSIDSLSLVLGSPAAVWKAFATFSFTVRRTSTRSVNLQTPSPRQPSQKQLLSLTAKLPPFAGLAAWGERVPLTADLTARSGRSQSMAPSRANRNVRRNALQLSSGLAQVLPLASDSWQNENISVAFRIMAWLQSTTVAAALFTTPPSPSLGSFPWRDPKRFLSTGKP